MTPTLTTASQRRAYKIFKDTFYSFTHECAWSFLVKVGAPISWVGNTALVPQYQQVNSVFVRTERLVPIFLTELLTLDQTTIGMVSRYCLIDNTHIAFYQIPSSDDKSLLNIEYVSELPVPSYNDTNVIPFTDNFVAIMEHMMSAKLCLQMLDDQSGYSSFMREYSIRLMKSVQKDQRISRSRPNMFRGGR